MIVIELMECVYVCVCVCCSDNLIAYSGGMPRASYSDRNTVTIQRGLDKTFDPRNSGRHLVFDFTSKVIDFFVTYSGDNDGDYDSFVIAHREGGVGGVCVWFCCALLFS